VINLGMVLLVIIKPRLDDKYKKRESGFEPIIQWECDEFLLLNRVSIIDKKKSPPDGAIGEGLYGGYSFMLL